MSVFRKFFLLLLCLSFYAQAEGSEMKVIQVNQNFHQIAVSIGEEFDESSDYFLTFDNQDQCRFEVSEIKEDIVILEGQNCRSRFKDIEIGQPLEKSLFSPRANERPETSTETVQTQEKIDEKQPHSNLPTKNEKWYLQLGVGLSSFSYSADVEAVTNELDSSPGVDSVGINLDILGIYFPINDHKTLLGGMLSAAAERWSGPGGSIQINQYLLGPSVEHFFGKNIGDGWFLRGDVGLAYYSIDIDTTAILYEEKSDAGFGTLFGGGYGIGVGKETRMLIHLNMAYRSVEGSSSTTANLTLGFLF